MSTKTAAPRKPPRVKRPARRIVMGVLRCCDDESESLRETTTVAPRPTFARRVREFAGWIVPAAGLALVPKCPACLAAYIAVGTGVGVSVPAATYLRMVLLVT